MNHVILIGKVEKIVRRKAPPRAAACWDDWAAWFELSNSDGTAHHVTVYDGALLEGLREGLKVAVAGRLEYSIGNDLFARGSSIRVHMINILDT
jgi:hypothetical protein